METDHYELILGFITQMYFLLFLDVSARVQEISRYLLSASWTRLSRYLRVAIFAPPGVNAALILFKLRHFSICGNI